MFRLLTVYKYNIYIEYTYFLLIGILFILYKSKNKKQKMSKTVMDKDIESPSTPQSLSESPPKIFRPDRQAASLLDQ